MTEPSSQAPGHVDLATLTSGLHVLGVAPAWSAVERALGRLDSARASGTGTHDPKVQEDLQTVYEFHQLLKRSAETVALALLCGAVLGQASSAESFGERLLAGLRAISRSYGFDRLAEEKRRECVLELRRKLKAEGLVPKPIYGIARPVKALDLSEWSDWCRRLRRAVEDAAPAERLRTELQTFRERAWSLWKDRLAPQPSMERRTWPSWPRFEPVLEDLVCATAGVSPANRLDLDLGRMNLLTWSDALFWALAKSPERHLDACPPWMIAPSIYGLGFRPRLPDGFLASWIPNLGNRSDTTLDEGLATWLDQWDHFFERGFRNVIGVVKEERPSILVVRRSEDSLTAGWKVAKHGGVLSLTSTQLEALGNSWAGTDPPVLSWIRVRLVVVEVPPDEAFKEPTSLPSDALQLRLLLDHLLSSRWPPAPKEPPHKVIALARDRSPPDWSAAIVGAKSADDLVERALPFLVRSAG